LSKNLLAAFLHAGLMIDDLSPRIAFRDTLKCCQDRDLISGYDSGELQRLMSLRNPLSHFRTVADYQHIDRRAIRTGIRFDTLIEQDAKLAIGLAVHMSSKRISGSDDAAAFIVVLWWTRNASDRCRDGAP